MGKRRTNVARAEEIEREVVELKLREPKLKQHEIAQRLGISRSMAAYYLSGRRGAGPRQKPGVKKLRRTEHYIAIRAAAVRAAHEAFPTMLPAELADALGISRHMVKHYLLGDIKSAHRQPAWAEEFFSACRALVNNSQPARAAVLFEALARRLHQGDQS